MKVLPSIVIEKLSLAVSVPATVTFSPNEGSELSVVEVTVAVFEVAVEVASVKVSLEEISSVASSETTEAATVTPVCSSDSNAASKAAFAPSA